MRYILLSIFCLCLILNTQAQQNASKKIGTIKGKVIDKQLNEPLPYVNVVILDQQNKTITGAISSDNGSFEINNIAAGNYTTSLQFIGFKTINIPTVINTKNRTIDLGIIYLEEETANLGEVTVVAEVSTIQQKIDRKVITVGKDLTTAGATAGDIMNNLPSVNVDQQTGNISLRGNENVRVMVDGKLSNVPIAQLLKQIPSTSIKQIELITNPSAKYNPEGMSGIINIKLYKNTKLGFNGNVNVGLTKEINAKFNSSVDMNYRNGKFNLYGNYGVNIGKSDNYGGIKRTDDNSRQDFIFDNNNKSNLYKVGIDYYMNDKNTISFFTNQNTFNGKGTGNTLITYPTKSQEQNFNNESSNHASQYNLAYKHDFNKEDENLEIEVDYNNFKNDELANFTYRNFDFPPNYTDDVDTKRDQTTINIDYVNPLTESTKLELGAEARLFNTNIDYQSTGYTFNEDGNIIKTPATLYDYARNIYSLYATYGKEYEKWNYQIGARAEQVNVDANAKKFLENNTQNNPFTNNYFQIYPSAFITYNPSDKNAYQLSFSRRVDRPGISQVNPIREWSTPRVSSYGNPNLKPQFTNSVETNYTRKLKNGSITAGVFYRFIEDNISRAVFVDRTDVPAGNSILSYDNFDNTTAYGIELSSNYRPTKWWSLNGSFDLFSQTQKGITEYINRADIENATVNDIASVKTKAENLVWNVRMFNNFRVNKKLNLSLFGLYRGEQEGIQFTRKPMYFVNTGLRYSFLKENRATFSFNYNDIFNTMKFEFEGDTPYPSTGGFNWESNTWNIALSYRFGGGKYRALKRKQRDDNEKSGSGGFM